MPINRNILKTYAPQARREFIQAVTDRASVLGLSEKKIEPAEVAGDVAIIAGRPFPKEVAASRKKLEDRITLNGFTQVMEEVAYTWFNRFTALRYMELHDYLGHGYHVLSNPSGSDIPEILEKATSVDLPGLDKDKVTELRLAGDKDAELYQMLLIKQCNALHRVMPALFEAVNDATELLLPQNLLQSNSPIRKLVNDIPEENWSEIEIVGWLYQFYISEKKGQVIGKVVKSEDIPAATQLFTPNWIVKYMVQNTLGRKWLMTYPGSSIKGKMEFYIEPAAQEPEVQAKLDAITPKELNPEELTFMDPACGSGHILAEAYDLFKDIYQERGYRTRDIPRLILEKNLHGLDIDDRAAQLARFTVLMKARADDRRILDPENPAKLNIMAIQESKGLNIDAVAGVLLRERVKELGRKGGQQLTLVQPKFVQGALSETEMPDVTKEELFSLLHLFENGKTFGSLLTVHDRLKQALSRIEKLVAKALHASDMESRRWAEALIPLTRQAKLLAQQYEFVVANPPYMGGRGFFSDLKKFANDKYPVAKADLYAMFIEKSAGLAKDCGFFSLITMQSWMFLPSFVQLRKILVSKTLISSALHLGARAFDSINGEVVQTVSFVNQKLALNKYRGTYFRLLDGKNEFEKISLMFNGRNRYITSSDNFFKIPEHPIAYWIDKDLLEVFFASELLEKYADPRQGLATSDDQRFLRFWYEVDGKKFAKPEPNSQTRKANTFKWYPCTKGGSVRRWYGNNIYIINWENDGKELLEYATFLYKSPTRTIKNISMYFKEGLSWSSIRSKFSSMRFTPGGFIFTHKGPMCFPKKPLTPYTLLSFLNSTLINYFLEIISPTLDFGQGAIRNIPYKNNLDKRIEEIARECITLAKDDWDEQEFSWDFVIHPLLTKTNSQPSLEQSLNEFRIESRHRTESIQRFEIENSKIWTKLFNLTHLIDCKIPIHEVTLNCNPCFQLGANKSSIEYNDYFFESAIKTLVSYAIGCMMGRYSLDEPGLIYAHSGNEGFDPSRYTTFPADEDGIVPVMDDDWFEDDATIRFVEFLKVAWSPETLDENLKFVADSLDPKQDEKPLDTIRRFISQKFFKDQHLKVYKKRPIYWLFSSGKHKAFECLVYLHRYNENTLARMRAMYVTPLQGKYNARIEFLDKEKDNASSSSAAKKLQKELDVMRKKHQELREFDELLRHYADQRITLDLDDGVKVNYGKFGSLLAEVKTITGDSGD